MIRFISPHANYCAICIATKIQIIDGRQVMEHGFSAQFRDGRYNTDDPKEIKLLRGHPRYKYDFYEIPETSKTSADPAGLGLGEDVVDDPHQPAAESTKKKKTKTKGKK